MGLVDAARLVGYKNVDKGANRIRRFEDGGKFHPDLLDKLADLLGIGPEEIGRLLAEDRRDWLAWADEPIRPYLVVRLLACVYQRVTLPDDALDRGAAENFASGVARSREKRVWLILSRRLSVEFDSYGKRRGEIEASPGMPCEPHASIGGGRFQFEFGDGIVVRPLDDK